MLLRQIYLECVNFCECNANWRIEYVERNAHPLECLKFKAPFNCEKHLSLLDCLQTWVYQHKFGKRKSYYQPRSGMVLGWVRSLWWFWGHLAFCQTLLDFQECHLYRFSKTFKNFKKFQKNSKIQKKIKIFKKLQFLPAACGMVFRRVEFSSSLLLGTFSFWA